MVPFHGVPPYPPFSSFVAPLNAAAASVRFGRRPSCLAVQTYGQTTRLSFVACESMGNAKVPSGRGQICFSSTILMSVASTS